MHGLGTHVGHKHWDMLGILGHANRFSMGELNMNATEVTNASEYK